MTDGLKRNWTHQDYLLRGRTAPWCSVWTTRNWMQLLYETSTLSALPKMDERMDALVNETIFSVYAAGSKHWQDKMARKDKKAALPSFQGLFCFVTFRGLSDYTMHTLYFLRRDVHDPIPFQMAICSRIFGSHYQFFHEPEKIIWQVQTFQKLLRQTRTTRQLREHEILRAWMDNFAYVRRPGRLGISAQTTNATRGFKPAKQATELKSIRGLCNVYWRDIPTFAQIGTPRSKTLKKDEPPQSYKLSTKR